MARQAAALIGENQANTKFDSSNSPEFLDGGLVDGKAPVRRRLDPVKPARIKQEEKMVRNHPISENGKEPRPSLPPQPRLPAVSSGIRKPLAF